MLRKLFAGVVLLALPALLAAQRPSAPVAAGRPAVMHGVALHVQGQVVSPVQEVAGLNNEDGVNEAHGQNHDAENEDGEFEQEGVNEPDGLNNDVNVGEKVDQSGENKNNEKAGETPAPPSGIRQLRQVGRHRP